MTALSSRITELREQRGWSKTLVAKKLGLNLSTYANYEYGNREPDVQTLAEIAKVFGVSSDYLLTGKSARNTADLADKNTIFTYEGKEIPPEDLEYMKRILRGGRA